MSVRSLTAGAFLAWSMLAIGPGLVSHAAGPAAAPSDLERGRRLFDVHCARCHGIGGTGGEGPPLTSPELRHAPDEQKLIDVIQNGIPMTAMPATRALSRAEATLVAAYVRSLGHVEATPLTGDVERGRLLYEDMSCGACHIVRGEGQGLGPELTDIGRRRGADHLRESILRASADVADDYRVIEVSAREGPTLRGVRVNEDTFVVVVRDAYGRLHAFWKAELRGMRRVMGESVMQDYAGRLEDGAVEDLVAYLASLRGGEP